MDNADEPRLVFLTIRSERVSPNTASTVSYFLIKQRQPWTFLLINSLTGLVTLAYASLPSTMYNTSTLLRSFALYPQCSMNLEFQSPGLRKHPGVGLELMLYGVSDATTN